MAKKRGKKAVKKSVSAAKKVVPVKAGPPPRLPNIWVLTKTTWRIFWQHRRLFIGITLIYGLLNLLLVRGLAGGTDVNSLKSTVNQAFHGNFGALGSAFGVFVVLVGSAGNGSSQSAGAYQLFLGLIASLATIWALRQVLSGKKVRVRDAYYQGMYPLVPFILVLVIIGLQLLPLLIGSAIYSTVLAGGIAVHLIEKIFWLAFFVALGALSIYWINSSIFALYIVTLSDMTPLKALRSARGLVRGRRWMVLRKLLWLPLVLLLVAIIIMLPLIIWLSGLAQWVFFILTMFTLVAVHVYLYNLYRELLNE